MAISTTAKLPKHRGPYLNPKSTRLLDALDAAAQSWGWEQDQGHGKSVEESEQRYLKARRALIMHMIRMQEALKEPNRGISINEKGATK